MISRIRLLQCRVNLFIFWFTIQIAPTKDDIILSLTYYSRFKYYYQRGEHCSPAPRSFSFGPMSLGSNRNDFERNVHRCIVTVLHLFSVQSIADIPQCRCQLLSVGGIHTFASSDLKRTGRPTPVIPPRVRGLPWGC